MANKARFALDYRSAGVDVEAGRVFVDRIRSSVEATRRPEVLGGLGGFGGLFDLAACGFKDPVLVAANDGVGTKLKVAIEAGIRQGWDAIIGSTGTFIGMKSFGASGPAKELYKHFGITADAVVAAAEAKLA